MSDIKSRTVYTCKFVKSVEEAVQFFNNNYTEFSSFTLYKENEGYSMLIRTLPFVVEAVDTELVIDFIPEPETSLMA